MEDTHSEERVAEYLRVTFEAIDQAITIYDSELRLVAWNSRYESLGLMPEKFIHYGAPLPEAYQELAELGAFGEGDPKALAEQHLSALRDGPLIETEILTPPSGQLIRIRRFALSNGGVCATFADITEETMIQEQLRQSSKMDAIGRLTGGAAHDFNNVLAIIFGNLELALDAKDRTRANELIEVSLDAADRGAKLTHRLLAFARRQPLSPTVVRPNSILNELLTMLRSLLGEHIDVELVCDAGLWSIEVDSHQLENVVVNLAVNARDAMPDGGKLTIEATNARVDEHYARVEGINRGQYVCIACADTGVGMDKETMDKAFEPFFTTKESGAGTGLGLAMAHGFIKQSNGHIKLYSEPDEGTIVKIYLPRVTGSADAVSDENDEVEDPKADEKVILVVEDNHDLRQTIAAQLKSAGYQVKDAANGLDAIKILDAGEHVDLLLTDVVLPGGMNGRVLADKVSEMRPGISVIYMSGYSENAIIHHGRLDEGVTLIQKPFRRVDLIREVSRATS